MPNSNASDPAISFLMFETDPTAAETLQAMLRRHVLANAQIKVLSSLDDLMTELDTHHHDVCFLDDSSGDDAPLEALQWISAKRLRTAPIFLMSAEDPDRAFSALKMGALDYLVKTQINAFTLKTAVTFSIYRRHKERALEAVAVRDSLTGLGNRALFDEQLTAILALAKREQQRFALVYVDLDDFKIINDTFGHPAGDAVLAEVGKRIRGQIRESDLAARVGGDEFVTLLVRIESPVDAKSVAGKIHAAISSGPVNFKGQNIKVGASIGASVFPEDGIDVHALVAAADRRMYKFKAAQQKKKRVAPKLPAGQFFWDMG